MASLNTWFYMRDGFNTFRLDPYRHFQFLFGQQDRDRRDHMLASIEEASLALEGHKGVVFGDFGRGKTHQCKNITFETKVRHLPVFPVYVKCTEYKVKEPFASLFKELVLALPTETIHNMVEEYMHRGLTPLAEVTGSEDLARVFEKGLASPDLDRVRNCMRWLGGVEKVSIDIGHGLPSSLSVSKDFGGVMRGFVQLFRNVGIDDTPLVLTYLVDEAERIGIVTNPDAYWSWIASLRELTENVGLGIVFYAGVKTQDDIPAHLWTDEIRSRIGMVNYIEFFNPSKDEIRAFLQELFAAFVRKGPVPELHRAAAQEAGVNVDDDTTVPAKLTALLNESGEELETYPFTASAFDRFIESCSDELSDKPRELLIRVQRAATKAIRDNKRLIDVAVVDEIISAGVV